MSLNRGANWDAGTIELNNLATLQIPAGETLLVTTASGDASVIPPSFTSPSGVVSIAGTIRKEGLNTLTFGRSVFLSNGRTSVIDIRSGSVVVTDTLLQTSGRIAVANGATLRAKVSVNGNFFATGLLAGDGTVVGQVEVVGGRIRGGEVGTGTLTIGGNNAFLLRADSTISNRSRLLVETSRIGVGQAAASRVDVTGTGFASLTELRTGSKVILELLGPSLQVGETYTITLVTAGGGIRSNLFEVGGGYVFSENDYELSSPNFVSFTDVQLATTDANTLTLRFTPVPEPSLILALSGVGLGITFCRRLRYRVCFSATISSLVRKKVR